MTNATYHIEIGNDGHNGEEQSYAAWLTARGHEVQLTSISTDRIPSLPEDEQDAILTDLWAGYCQS